MNDSKFKKQLEELLAVWFEQAGGLEDTRYDSAYFDFHTITVLAVEFQDGPKVEIIARKSRDRESLLWAEVKVEQSDGVFTTNCYNPTSDERSIAVEIDSFNVDDERIGNLSVEDVNLYAEYYRSLLECDLSDLHSYTYEESDPVETDIDFENKAVRDCLVARFQEKLKCDKKTAEGVYDMWSSHTYDNLLDLVDSNIEPLFEANGSTLNINRENLSDFYHGVAKTSRKTGLSISDVLTTLDFIEQIRPFNEVEESVIEPLVDLVKPYWPLSYSYETPTEGECCGEC